MSVAELEKDINLESKALLLYVHFKELKYDGEKELSEAIFQALTSLCTLYGFDMQALHVRAEKVLEKGWRN